MDIYGQNKEEGAQVVAWDYNGGVNQMWSLTSEGYLKSLMNGLVLEIAGMSYYSVVHLKAYNFNMYCMYGSAITFQCLKFRYSLSKEFFRVINLWAYEL